MNSKMKEEYSLNGAIQNNTLFDAQENIVEITTK